MSDPFSRFGVKHLSPSSLNCWRAQPALWVIRYLCGVKDAGNASMWRGTAVEGGFEAILRGMRVIGDATQIALANFDRNAMGETNDDIDAERAAVPGYIESLVGYVNAKRLPPLLGTQVKIEHWFDNVPVPCLGYIDFTFEDDWLIDLKSTQRIPSAPRTDHARQVSLYKKARGTDKGGLLYCSPKRAEFYDVPDVDTHLAGMRRDALALMRFLDRCETPEDAALSLPHDTDGFMWSDASRAKALEVWHG